MGKKVIYSVYVKVSPYSEFHVCTKEYEDSEAPFFDGRAAGYQFYREYEGLGEIPSKAETFAAFAQAHPEDVNNQLTWMKYYNQVINERIKITVFPEGVIEDET